VAGALLKDRSAARGCACVDDPGLRQVAAVVDLHPEAPPGEQRRHAAEVIGVLMCDPKRVQLRRAERRRQCRE